MTKLKPTTLMPADQTLRGKYAESAMKGILSTGYKMERDEMVEESFKIADRMIETEFKK